MEACRHAGENRDSVTLAGAAVFALATVWALSAPKAYANPGVTLGVPAYGGSGCPGGSASATISPDGRSLSLLFDQYQARAGGQSGQAIDRKTCNIAIPVHVPQGYSVSILSIDYRGFNSLPAGARSQFDVEYFFAGNRGPGWTRSFTGPQSESFVLNNQVVAEATVWSACGADVNLRTNTSLLVNSNSYNQEALASVDSADVAASVIYQLQWKRCGDGGGFPPGGGYPPGGGGGGGGGYPLPPQDPMPIDYRGDCSIDRTYDMSGRDLYRVRNIYGDQIASAYTYGDALREAQRADIDGRCLRGRAGGGGALCRVQTIVDAYGRTVYRVVDQVGQPIADYTNYADAQNAALMFERNGQCSYGQVPGRPVPGRPVPGQPPGRGYHSCQIREAVAANGRRLFRVVTRTGAIVDQAPTYIEADRRAQQNRQCR